MNKLYIIANERAYLDENLRDAVAAVRSDDMRVEVNAAWEADDVSRLTGEAIEKGATIIIAAGGDGTLHTVASEFYSQQPGDCSLSVLPYGTANDFALANRFVVNSPSANLPMIVESSPTKIDIVSCSDRIFINSCTGGYGAKVTTETAPELKRLLGGLSYFLTGVGKLADFNGINATISSDDVDWQGNLFAIAIGNGRQAGGGVSISRTGLLNDGIFEGLIVPEFDLMTVGELAKEVIANDHPEAYRHIIRFQQSWLEIETTEDIQFNLDGEPIYSRSLRLDVKHRSLPFILPPRSELIQHD